VNVIARGMIAAAVGVMLPLGLLAAPAQAASVTDRFYRETAAYGAKDKDVRHIAHVRELQYRLRWAGVYGGTVNGSYNSKVRTAVKAYQKKVGLPQTGVANQATWAKLLPATIKGTSRIPAACRKSGWHACYDRTNHQVVLFRNNVVINTWLVRGGSKSLPTRVGNFAVKSRNIDHVSSIYDSAMPYSQFFNGGQAFHGSGLMMNPFIGHSHGCVNMYIEDAQQLWKLTAGLPRGALKVHVYGAWS
jgi:peptidoglycan hydrolase-like protein with peptidoglycan-binding domain